MIQLSGRAATTACVAVALCVFAQPAQAQQERTKRFRVEAGYSSNHEGSDQSIGGALRFGIALGEDGLIVETGLLAGAPYAGVDAGLEMRFPRSGAFAVVLRGGTGLLIEDGFTGAFFRGGGGVEIAMSPQVALRATAQAGYHGGESGPHHLYVGLDYRW